MGDRLTTVTFDSVTDVGGVREDPDLFLQNHPPPLFLDEIQYAPELTGAIKRYVDTHREPGLFVLSGSQQFEVIKRLAVSLVGRVAFIDLFPLSWAEMTGAWIGRFLENWLEHPGTMPEAQESPQTGWHHVIWRGGYPGLLGMKEQMISRFFTGYERTYIERDLREMSNVADLQVFGRFYKLLAGMSASELIDTKLGKELGIDRRTVSGWRSLLEQSFQWVEIPGYTRNCEGMSPLMGNF